MERLHVLNKIKTKLAIFETEVRIADANGEYDINRHAQTMLIPILNVIYDCNFLNLDYVQKLNFPAIDLGDPSKRLAVQVTATGSTQKVAQSLEKFNSHALGKDYSDLLFYFIQEPKANISLSANSVVNNLGCLKENNIQFLSNNDLYRKLAASPDTDKLRCVLGILQKEYPDTSPSSAPARALTPIPPYDHDAGLIGRDCIFNDIRTLLTNSFPVIVLAGPGGIGKTSVAAKLCHIIKSENSASIAWITYSGDIKSDLLKLELFKDLSPAQRQSRILEFLYTTTEPLYLFIDNVKTRLGRTDIGLINQFSHSVRVIITSRNRINAFQSIKLPALGPDDAFILYKAYSKRPVSPSEMTAFKQLLKYTSSNTLLIELLAKYASRNALTLPALLKQLESRGILAMNSGHLETVYVEKTMSIMDFLLDLYDISELSPEQKHIMKLLSIFPAERSVPIQIAKWASLDMAELHLLSEWGWIKCTGDEMYPSDSGKALPPADDSSATLNSTAASSAVRLLLHSIIRDVVSSQDSEPLRFDTYGNFLKKVSDTSTYLGRNIPFSTAQIDIIVPEAVAEYRLSHHMVDTSTADLCLNLSKSFKRNGDLEKAEKFAKKARQIYQKTSGRDSSSLARALSQYATVLSDMGQLEHAVRIAQASLDIRRTLSVPSAEASSYDLLGTIYGKAGNLDAAQCNLETALSIREKINPEAADTANTLHHLGIVYGSKGRTDTAITCLKKALSIRKILLGNNHLQIASTLSRLGDIYRSTEDFTKALGYYEEALSIFEALSATEHPFAESTYFGLGYCYKEFNLLSKASEAFRLAYQISLAVYGPNHPHTLEAEKQMR